MHSKMLCYSAIDPQVCAMKDMTKRDNIQIDDQILQIFIKLENTFCCVNNKHFYQSFANWYTLKHVYIHYMTFLKQRKNME